MKLRKLFFAVTAMAVMVAHVAQAADVTWDASTDRDWTEPDSTSWSGGTYNSGDTVQFLGAGAGNVTNQAGGVTPAAVIVNSSAGYTFTGGSIGGTGTLAKAGSGTLTLSSTNTYSGGTTISGGTVAYSSDDNLGLAGSRNITFDGTGTLTWGFDGSSLGILTLNTGSVATLSSLNTISFATTTGSGDVVASGGQNKTASLGDASSLTGDVVLGYNANNNSGANVPHIQFTKLNDAVGSSLQFYRRGGGTDSGQIGIVALAGNAGALTFDKRQIQLLPKTGGAGQSMASIYLLSNNGAAANKWVINTPLHNRYDRDVSFYLAGSNPGDNEFAGTIGNSTNGTYTSGSGILSLVKADGGKWIVSGTNTFTGSVTVNAGTLALTGVNQYTGATGFGGNGSLLFSSIKDFGVASSLGKPGSGAIAFTRYASSQNLIYVGSGDTANRTIKLDGYNISDSPAGAVLNNGTGPLIFTANPFNEYGTTASRKVTLSLGGTYTGGTNQIQGAIQNYNSNVSDKLYVNIYGICTWMLSGANTFTGTSILSGGGTLVLDYTSQDNSKLSDAPGLTLNNGAANITLRGGTHIEAVGSLTISTGGGHTSITRDGGSSTIAFGAITRAQSGYVTMSLSEDNLATTTSTPVNGILSGGITVGSNWAKVSSSNIVALTAGDYTNLTAAGASNTNNYQLTGSLTRGAAAVNSLRIVGDGNDQVLTISSGNLTASQVSVGGMGGGATGGILYAGGGNDNYTITGPGAMQAQNGNQELIINTYQGTLNAAISLTMGLQGLAKTGVGTLCLSSNGTYTGSTYVNQGVLRLLHANGAGTTGGITVFNNAALELSNSINVGAKALSITGTGISNGGALRNTAGNTSTYGGVITIGDGGALISSDSGGALALTNGIVTAVFRDVTIGGNGNTTASGVISGAGRLIKDGSGNLTLSGASANTLSGETMINSGTLVISSTAANAIANGSVLRIASGAKLELASGVNETVGALYLDGQPASPGSWGSLSSGATNTDVVYFTGTGMITVSQMGTGTPYEAQGPAGTVIQLK